MRDVEAWAVVAVSRMALDVLRSARVRRERYVGPWQVARFLLGVLAKGQPGDKIDRVLVNGAPGFAVYQQGELVTIVSVTAGGGRVTRLDAVRAPGKLPRLVR